MQTETLDNKTLEGHKGTSLRATAATRLLAPSGADHQRTLQARRYRRRTAAYSPGSIYKNELAQWNAEVLPLLEQAGLAASRFAGGEKRSRRRRPASGDDGLISSRRPRR